MHQSPISLNFDVNSHNPSTLRESWKDLLASMYRLCNNLTLFIQPPMLLPLSQSQLAPFFQEVQSF
jgi:hypothetical protein